MIGSQPGLADVVYNGIATPAWDFNNHTFISPPSNGWDTFYVQLNVTQGVQLVESITAFSSNTSVCEIQLGGELMSNMTITEHPVGLQVSYTCYSQGRTDIFVVLNFGANYSSTLFRYARDRCDAMYCLLLRKI